MKPRLNLSDQRFGRLVAAQTVEGVVPVRWLCKCDCGRTVEVTVGALRSGNTTSCGCSRRSHGKSNAFAYKSWIAMRHRCRSKSAYSGVTICARWNDFEKFLEDMGDRPVGTTLDRIDNSRGYEPANCRWVTKQQQSANRRTVRNITFADQTKCVAEWAREFGIHEDTLRARLKKKPFEEVFADLTRTFK